MALAFSKMRAHDCAVQPPAQPRLVACLGLIACLQLLLFSSLTSMSIMTKMVKVWGVLEFYFLEW